MIPFDQSLPLYIYTIDKITSNNYDGNALADVEEEVCATVRAGVTPRGLSRGLQLFCIKAAFVGHLSASTNDR